MELSIGNDAALVSSKQKSSGLACKEIDVPFGHKEIQQIHHIVPGLKATGIDNKDTVSLRLQLVHSGDSYPVHHRLKILKLIVGFARLSRHESMSVEEMFGLPSMLYLQ